MAVAGSRASAHLPAVRCSQLTGAGASAALGAAPVVRARAAATAFSAAGRPAACAAAPAASARRSIQEPQPGMLVAPVPRRAGALVALPRPGITCRFARAGIWTAVELLQVPPRPALAARQPRGCASSKHIPATILLTRPWCRPSYAPASRAALIVAAALPRPAHALPGSIWLPLEPAALPGMRRLKAARPMGAPLRGRVCAGRPSAAMP